MSMEITLTAVTDLVSQYDPEEMNRLEIHPRRWNSEEERVALTNEFEHLRTFMERAARDRCSLVVVLA
ncbi:MAG: DUF1877 family protein [Planctomycetes bacterium]|nr:DUF1877 family protein [Planctomycetota bacterium]